MRIDELSVGDWVLYDKGTTPYSIRSVYRTGIQDCAELNDSKYPEGVIAFVDRLQPIPITEEILEKNGLEFIDDGTERIPNLDAAQELYDFICKNVELPETQLAQWGDVIANANEIAEMVKQHFIELMNKEEEDEQTIRKK